MRTVHLAPFLACMLLAAPSRGAWAQSNRSSDATKKGDDKVTGRAAAIVMKLQSKDPATVRAAFEELHEAGAEAKQAAPVANDVLRRGLPVDLAAIALRALGEVGEASSSPVIRSYLYHRVTPLRREAAKALIKTRGRGAKDGLRAALSDADPMVRGIAATGLGVLGATEHVSALFEALDHAVPEAAAAIGQLCEVRQCQQFAAKIGQTGFDVMVSGLDQILFRDPAEISDDDKIRIIGEVRELGTADAHAFLKDVQERWPEKWSRRVKRAIDLAVQSTRGAPGGQEVKP